MWSSARSQPAQYSWQAENNAAEFYFRAATYSYAFETIPWVVNYVLKTIEIVVRVHFLWYEKQVGIRLPLVLNELKFSIRGIGWLDFTSLRSLLSQVASE